MTRFPRILRRFGLTKKKSENAILDAIGLTKSYNCTPSFCITADLINGNDDFMSSLMRKKVDLGIHGYHHIDYSDLSYEEQNSQIKAAIAVFKKNEIDFSGFRAPYLRFSNETSRAIASNDFSWASNHVVFHNLDGSSEQEKLYRSIKGLLDTSYAYISYENGPSLPWVTDTYVEIPVSVPDDELLIDRLKVSNPIKIAQIWLDMLNRSCGEGELLNLLFHPERFHLLRKPLDMLLKRARDRNDIWVASLREIASWWQQKRRFKFIIEPAGNHKFKIRAECTKKASICIRRAEGKLELVPALEKSPYVLESPRKPVIGIAADAPGHLIEYLLNDGYPILCPAKMGECALYLDKGFNGTNKDLQMMIAGTRFPLVQFWRWPEQFRGALAITTDIDALSLWDFIRRPFCFNRSHF
ncbi:MAG: DUF2334 domain-containing protein [candidate division Zixibacteria bacterium]|nr:DUF2334 domain-containing protein [candidate division Zixibacteria bacterium]